MVVNVAADQGRGHIFDLSDPCPAAHWMNVLMRPTNQRHEAGVQSLENPNSTRAASKRMVCYPLPNLALERRVYAFVPGWEATGGFEPPIGVLQTPALTTWPRRRAETWSGRRDLNPRPSPWQGDTLPLSHSRRTAPSITLARD